MRNKKAFLSGQCKEREEANRMRKSRNVFKKLEIPREHFIEMGSIKTKIVWT